MNYLLSSNANPNITDQIFENQDFKTNNILCTNNITTGGDLVSNQLIADTIIGDEFYNRNDIQAPVKTLYGITCFKDGVSINGPPYNGTCATVNGSLSININQLIINANSSVTGTITGPHFKSDNNIFLSLESTSSGTGYLNIFLLSRNNGSFTYAIVNNNGSNFTNNQVFTILYSAF